MVDRIPTSTNGSADISSLPKEMTGIEIASDFWSNCIAQLEQCLGIVDYEIGMHFQGDLPNPITSGEFDSALPIRNDTFLPLPLKGLEEFWRPGGDNPGRQHRLRI